MGSSTAVAVIGAGPYGLAVAAHLAGAGLRPRVFGRPMQTWREYMPNGMVLKSEGFAMNVSDPSGTYTLGAHCAEQNIPYQDVGWPVPVEVFAGYGEAFASRFVPQAEAQDVVSVGKRGRHVPPHACLRRNRERPKRRAGHGPSRLRPPRTRAHESATRSRHP